MTTTSRLRGRLGLATAVLLLGHLLPLFIVGKGVNSLDWNTMAARWAALPWRIWDLALVLVCCAYAAVLLWGWWRGHRERLVSGICYGVLIVAVLLAGCFAIVTFSSGLG